MRKFGLVGKNIDYSFSKTYFENKFKREQIQDSSYENFDIESINQLPDIIKNTKSLRGLNITIPYKEAVIPYLDKLSKTAKKIGAVNTIRITKKGKLIGHNTDAYGFKKSLKKLLSKRHSSALILGTGGASKAVSYALKELDITTKNISRNAQGNYITYSNVDSDLIKNNLLIINTTPLGTFPNIQEYPEIPYKYLTKNHILYDLTYNPSKTEFLKKGEKYGCKTVNGLKMLEYQAEKAWLIWNK